MPLMATRLALPYGFKDAKYILLVQSIVGDFLQGETSFVMHHIC